MHLWKWLYPGMHFKRWLLLYSFGVIFVSLGLALIFNYKYLEKVEEAIFRFVYSVRGSYDYQATALIGGAIVAVGVLIMLVATHFVIRSVIMILLPEGSGDLVDIIYEKRRLSRGPAITVMGGGHGLSVLLRGLKQSGARPTAIVTVADDGGSSGRLREELGIIPPGDLRNCLVALADTEPLMEKLFQYRFGGTKELAGHSFGNLFLAAMNGVTGDIQTALEKSSEVLAVKGRVLPASTQRVRLDATMEDGSVVCGESNIPLAKKRIKRVHLTPEPVLPLAESLAAIRAADAVILGPGSLYTSVMPNLLVDGVADALRRSDAVKIYVCNVMTQSGETDEYTAAMHVKAIFDHAGKDVVDYVIVNSRAVDADTIIRYAAQGEFPVKIDRSKLTELGVGYVATDIINETDGAHHDPDKLTAVINDIIAAVQNDSHLRDVYEDAADI